MSVLDVAETRTLEDPLEGLLEGHQGLFLTYLKALTYHLRNNRKMDSSVFTRNYQSRVSEDSFFQKMEGLKIACLSLIRQ